MTFPVTVVALAVDVTDSVLRGLICPTAPPKITCPDPADIVKLGSLGLLAIASTAPENVIDPFAVVSV